VVVADDELDAGETAALEAREELAPLELVLVVSEFDGDHGASAIEVDTDGDENGLASDDAVVGGSAEARVEDEVGVGFLERSRREALEFDVELLDEAADRGSAERVSAQLLGDSTDLARGDAVEVDLREGGSWMMLTARSMRSS
jgi:hypothetical protein